MRDLVIVELTRLRWRRAVVALLVAAVVLPAIIVIAVLVETRGNSPAELQRAEAQAATEAAQPFVQKDLQRCVDRPRRYGVGPGDDVTAACERVILPRAEFYLTRSDLDLVEQREAGTSLALGALLVALMLILGTTFAGHDWNSGSMSNQLLFEPRRARIWAAKGLAVLLVCGAVSLLVLVGSWTVLSVAAQVRDLSVPDQAVAAGYKQAVLLAGLAGGAGLGGFALTMLFRSTVATLGVLFAVAAFGTLLIGAVGFGSTQWVQPPANFAAYAVGSYTYVDYNDIACNTGVGGDQMGSIPADCTVRIDRAQSILYFGGLLLAVSVASVLSFRRRDVP